MSSSLKLPMTYEVTCGHCHDRLRVEPTTDHVACPHCNAVLAVPSDVARLAENPTLEPSPDDADTGSPEHPGAEKPPSLFDSSVIRAADAPGSSPDFSRWGAPSSSTNAAASAFHPVVHSPSEPPASSIPAFVADATPTKTVNQPPATDPVAAPAPAAASATPASPRTTGQAATEAVSRKTFLALLIYASIVTALCLGLLFLQLGRRSHQLESLPDVVPPHDEDGKISHVLAPVDAPLPAGHVLALGESQRFGDLLVTPLKVTREPLGFTHYRGEETREPAGEVLKLWLRLENVSDDGTSFAPLDADLLFYRGPSTSGAYTLRANNFLAPAGDRSPGSLIAVYDHPPASDWNLAGQDLGAVLAPGETLVTYVPTETGVSAPEGPLTWRVQLRKGIAGNGWGVTTLVEVAFDEQDAQGS
ncbi:MAG: hypothetical protein WBC44_12720 [Planctomycetaceae bacterium]